MQKEKTLPQRDIDRDLNINSRDTPSREIVNNLAKKRALERREREKQRENEKPKKKRATYFGANIKMLCTERFRLLAVHYHLPKFGPAIC